MNTDTPRTDAHYKTTKTAWPTQGDIEFARELECENARLRTERDEARRIADAYRHVWEKCRDAVDETPNDDPLPWSNA